MDTAERFARNIRRIRTRKKWSQADVGKRFDPPVSRFYVSHMERGKRKPTLKSIVRFAAALKVEPHTLLR